MKYIVDLPNEYVAGGQIDVPVSINGYTAWIKTGIVLTLYTEPDTSDAEVVADAYKKWYETEYGDGTEAVVIPKDKVHEAYQRGYSAGKVDAYDEDAKKITKWIKKSEEAYKKGYEDGFIAGHKKIQQYEQEKEERIKVEVLANDIGIHKLFALVKEIRGE